MTLKEPIYPKLIRAFYSNVVVHVGGPITISLIEMSKFNA